MKRTVLITGANRGIGLSFARLFKEKGDEVIALCRKATPELKNLSVTVYEDVEVRDEKALNEVANKLKGKTIDILINNAGIYLNDTINFSFDKISEQLEVNALAPLKVTKAFLPFLKKGSKIAMLTSLMGSIADNMSGGYYGYRMSKAALNAAGKSLSLDLRENGIAVVLLHPGYVKTDMTQGRGEITPEHSAKGLIEAIEKLDMHSSGSFIDYEGDILPW